jgi:NADH:ubiquinone oxidoreductase subunit 2 (subunit N)
MAMEGSLIRRRKRQRRSLRLMGFMFALFGTAFVVIGIQMLLDPTATMTCNGVVTTSPGCKRSFATLGAVFAVAGFAFLFAKSRWLDTLFVWCASLRSLLPWSKSHPK